MAKRRKVNPERLRNKSQSKVEGAKTTSHGGLQERRADETSDWRYLEVVEEMLRQRENNGRDRDERTGSLKDDD